MARRSSQRAAIATSLGWDLSEVTEYQNGHWANTTEYRGTTKVYDLGSGYAIALPIEGTRNKPVPRAIEEQFGPFFKREDIAGYAIYTADPYPKGL
jgi:hypothetical protein